MVKQEKEMPDKAEKRDSGSLDYDRQIVEVENSAGTRIFLSTSKESIKDLCRISKELLEDLKTKNNKKDVGYLN